MKRILVLIFLYGAFSAVINAQSVAGLYHSKPEAAETFGAEYFPLKKNSSFVFESNVGQTKANVKAEGNQMVFTYEAGPITYRQNLMLEPNGIYLKKVYSKALFFSNTVTYSKPVLRLPLPLKPGDNWRWDGCEIVDGDSSKITLLGSVKGVENIRTKAGAFRCLKIELKIISAKGSTNTETEWLAPNVGIVRLKANIQGDGITGVIRRLMGLNEIVFSLTEIKK